MLKRIRSDERGVAAVEFALCAPVFILLYCGLAELSIGMMADRRAAHAASVVADLVAQTPQITTAQVSDIYAVGNSILAPFPSNTLKMRVTSVTADAQGVPKVDWSLDNGNGLTALTPTKAVAGFPAGLLAPGDSVIEADVQYSWTSPLQYVVHDALGFSNTFYLKPRNSNQVLLTG